MVRAAACPGDGSHEPGLGDVGVQSAPDVSQGPVEIHVRVHDTLGPEERVSYPICAVRASHPGQGQGDLVRVGSDVGPRRTPQGLNVTFRLVLHGLTSFVTSYSVETVVSLALSKGGEPAMKPL